MVVGVCLVIQHVCVEPAGPSTTEALLIGLAGGAIGALLAGAAWALLKLTAIRGEVERHDFEARVLDEDLELWAADDYRSLKQALTELEKRVA